MKKLNFRENWSVYVGMLAGLSLVIVGMIILMGYKKYYGDMRYITFGADFYTEIHEATARAVNTLRSIYEMIRVALGTFMVATGVSQVAIWGGKLKFTQKDALKANEESIE